MAGRSWERTCVHPDVHDVYITCALVNSSGRACVTDSMSQGRNKVCGEKGWLRQMPKTGPSSIAKELGVYGHFLLSEGVGPYDPSASELLLFQRSAGSGFYDIAVSLTASRRCMCPYFVCACE